MFYYWSYEKTTKYGLETVEHFYFKNDTESNAGILKDGHSWVKKATPRVIITYT